MLVNKFFGLVIQLAHESVSPVQCCIHLRFYILQELVLLRRDLGRVFRARLLLYLIELRPPFAERFFRASGIAAFVFLRDVDYMASSFRGGAGRGFFRLTFQFGAKAAHERAVGAQLHRLVLRWFETLRFAGLRWCSVERFGCSGLGMTLRCSFD